MNIDALVEAAGWWSYVVVLLILLAAAISTPWRWPPSWSPGA
ncbi:hypothetical protein [Streptomyces sp. GESEQ-35]|nr:hypothetical protein [Streptomyces sp. GESEQ-35]